MRMRCRTSCRRRAARQRCLGCRRRWRHSRMPCDLRRRAGRAGRAAQRVRDDAEQPVSAATAALPRWTCSLSGSRARSSADDAARQRLDGGNLQRQPRVVDLRGESASPSAAAPVRAASSCRQRSSAGEAAARRAPRRRAGRRERIERNIDAVEIAVVLAAILQVIDDLQRRAERVVGAARWRGSRHAHRARSGRPASPNSGNSRSGRPNRGSAAW